MPESTVPFLSDVHLQQTARQQRKHDAANDTKETVLKIIRFMNAVDMNLAVFMQALFYGCPELISHGLARWQRTVFVRSHELPGILQSMLKPPVDHNRSG